MSKIPAKIQNRYIASPWITVGTMSGASISSRTAADRPFDRRQQPIAHKDPRITEAMVEATAMTRLWTVDSTQIVLMKNAR